MGEGRKKQFYREANAQAGPQPQMTARFARFGPHKEVRQNT